MTDQIEVIDLPEPTSEATEQAETGAEETLDSSPLRRFFYGNNTDLSEQEIKDLNLIWGHFSQGAGGPGETLGRIRDLERSLSQPPPGVSRIQHILSYTRLLQNEEDIQKEKSAYYGQ